MSNSMICVIVLIKLYTLDEVKINIFTGIKSAL